MESSQFAFEVSGAYALFSDPLAAQRTRRQSYDVPTYEALKGVAKAVYWKPTFNVLIDGVRIMNPISFEDRKLLEYAWGAKGETRNIKHAVYLRDVRYQVLAHFVWNESRPEYEKDRDLVKHKRSMEKWISRGGHRDVYLGTRECQADVKPCEFGSGDGYYDKGSGHENPELGVMYFGYTYPDEAILQEDKGYKTIRFFNAHMENGYIRFPDIQECITGKRIEMQPKIFRTKGESIA